MGLAVAHDPTGGGAGWVGVPLCHVAGANAADPGVPPTGAPVKGAPCPFCLGLAAGAAALLPPPVSDGIVVARAALLAPVRPAASSSLSRRTASMAQPRAPPLFT
jgi:hypothetical protein